MNEKSKDPIITDNLRRAQGGDDRSIDLGREKVEDTGGATPLGTGRTPAQAGNATTGSDMDLNPNVHGRNVDGDPRETESIDTESTTDEPEIRDQDREDWLEAASESESPEQVDEDLDEDQEVA